jgi:catalase
MFQLRQLAIIAIGFLAISPLALAAQEKSLPQQIADVMVQLNGGVHTGFRFAHSKGLVLTGSFTPAKGAASISRAAHLQGPVVPVTVRLSDGTGVPQINDDNPNASPRGMAIRFALPKGAFTDIVANSHNGFFVGTGDDFLAFLTAIAATKPDSPHPSPIEQFLGSHPRALKVIVDSKARPRSFATVGFFGTNDGSIVWPDDRKRVQLGTISLTTIAPNNEELQRSLAFNPIFITDGIQLSDDPFVPLRSAVYALSVAHRH